MREPISHDLGQAYLSGLLDAFAGAQPDNPYQPHEQQYRAYNSGYCDQVAWQAEHGRAP